MQVDASQQNPPTKTLADVPQIVMPTFAAQQQVAQVTGTKEHKAPKQPRQPKKKGAGAAAVKKKPKKAATKTKKASKNEPTAAGERGAAHQEGAGEEPDSDRVLRGCRDEFGRCVYQVERSATGNVDWVTADAVIQRLVCEYENAPRIDGLPALCGNPACPGGPAAMPKDAQSKYCSEQCALEVARARLRARLDARARGDTGAGALAPALATLPRPCVVLPPDAVALGGEQSASVKWLADSEAALAAALAKVGTAEARLAEIDAELAQLEKLVESARGLLVEAAADAEVADEQEVFDCPSCSHTLSAAKLPRHLAQCYHKREKSVLFGSTVNQGPIVYGQLLFCCAPISAKNKTFCRRLRNSCPLHGGPLSTAKQKPEEPAAAPAGPACCGFPRAPTGDLCRAPAGKCELHANWPQLWRSQLLQSRQSVLIVLEELRVEAESLAKVKDRAMAALQQQQ